MRITRTHIDYWRSKQPVPGWIDRHVSGGKINITVHECINDHADIRCTDGERSVHNLLALLRMKKRQQLRSKEGPSLLAYLDSLAIQPGTVCSPEKRSSFSRKWARRIRKNQQS